MLGGFLLLLVLGNAAIAGLSLVMRKMAPPDAVPASVAGVDNLTLVEDHLWRGGAPSLAGYDSLRAAGVSTIIDLRAETYADAHDEYIEALGMRVVHLPIRDGQIPTDAQVARFTAELEARDGIVFVHCGAGVGRTGSMVAAYRVQRGDLSGLEAAAANLGVGPPSLEQLAYAASLEAGAAERPAFPLVVLSRILDAPRRLLSNF